MEIERKFLVDKIPFDLSSCAYDKIEQGYIPVDLQIEGDIEERIRRKGERYFYTIKKGSGLKREETEREILLGEFESYWALTYSTLEKTRYYIPEEGLVIELDAYKGGLEGLVVAEVEFLSEEESRKFQPPDWFGREVTHDKRYSNKNIATYGKPRN